MAKNTKALRPFSSTTHQSKGKTFKITGRAKKKKKAVTAGGYFHPSVGWY